LLRAKDGKWDLAYKLYRNATVFPAIVSELCEAPCRAECQRGAAGQDAAVSDHGGKVFFVGDDPVDVRAVEAAAVRFAKNRKPEIYRIPPREQRVAIIGAGLAGLSLALNLSQKAYPVTVFERGGQALTTWAGHPKYEYFLEEISLQFSEVKTEFVYGCEISGLDDPALTGFSYVYDATMNTDTDAVSAIANSVEISKAVETWLQTGKWPGGEPRTSAGGAEGPARPEKHYVDHGGEQRKPIVVPADPAKGYTKEEASLEALRCMKCDCRACMDACEMLGRYSKRPQKIAIEAAADTRSSPPFSSCTLTRETYSCNLCGYCKTVCPVDVDLEKLFFMARQGRAETGKHPKAFHDFWLRDLEWHRTEGAYFSSSAGSADARYVFFPGCKLGARSPSQIKNAAAFLKERYGAGVILDCCGAPAYWAGEDKLFKSQIESLREKWEASKKPVFVFACAYCMRLFGEFLPEIEKISLYEILDENGLSSGRDGSFSVFDPCMARGFPEMERAVRKLAASGGAILTELPDRNHCCGFGGHMRAANRELFDTIVERRISADETSYLVYCANCAWTFALAGKANAHILDLVFGTDGAAESGKSLQQQRDNAIRAKAALMELYDGKTFEPAARPWDALRLEIPASLAAGMSLRLILEDDVKEAIYEAEHAGAVFALPGGAPDGGELRQCCLAREVVTIWAQYIKRGDDAYDYAITDAWSHRMRFSDTVD
jgi:Fe-S oxidoreductase